VLQTWLVDPAVPIILPPGAVVTAGKLNLFGWSRIRGQVVADVAGTLQVNFRDTGNGNVVMSYTVPQDAAQPNFTYSYDIIMLAPYVEIVYRNGGAPTTFFQANNAAYA
jgi:hypothetical protein